MLSKEYRYQILCEDKQTQCFVRYFLEYHNIKAHKINFCRLPYSCGEQYVRENYPIELRRLRATNYIKTCLIVVIDADKESVYQRRDSLDLECKNRGVLCRNKDDFVIYFIPKRNIETWISFFAGVRPIDEDTDYGHNRRHESECKPMSQKMAELFIIEKDADDILSSIKIAKDEYKNVVDRM